ncbi:Stk1 family PASTA domain-containing Ser/Thr kinase [Microbacterium sp. LWH12-1.2]|uniref:Stk1 family PASTA domain-containing Ser/Thr kinase n=1 Tax=Microbacterium sp. LWH12-1.2 TaxID=3135259 RepID=UPI00343FC3B9
MSIEQRVLAGRYRVDELIGYGGMAKVYRGQDLTLGREVAIKILDPDLARDTAFRTRFRLEAQAASRMSHPSIVRVYDAGDSTTTSGAAGSEDPPYIVMELVKGTLLKDIIAGGPVPVADAVRYIDGILEALDYSHRAGVIHRDIKPGNVMVTDKGQVKVMDFGIARAVSDSSSTVAETTQIIGTAAYFSPEQAKGEPVDARADLYSTGVVLYELLTGRQPFRGESPVAVAYQHVSETPVPPTEVNDESPGALDPIVLRALAKDPYQRFPDASNFRAALDAATTGHAPSRKQLGALTSELYGPSPRHAQETARSLRQLSTDTTMARTQSGPPVAWIWAGVALLAVLLVSVLFWVLTISMRPPEVPSSAVTVPDLVNVSAERAQEDLGKLDLTAKLVLESSTDIVEGNVIRTDPEPGVTVAEGDSITVYVSTGVKTSVVPSLEGLSRTAAEAALTAAGLEIGSVIQRNDKSLAADTVIEASEAADSEVAPGTAINLVVASGKVTLDDVTGWTLTSATTALEDLGLVATHVPLTDCAATNPNTVASMSVAPGDVAVGSPIELRYCTGK